MGIYKFIKSFLIVKVNNVVNFIELKSILIINLNTKITKIPEHIVFIYLFGTVLATMINVFLTVKRVV